MFFINYSGCSSIFVDGTKYAIQTNDRIYYSSSFSPNPLPISPELTGKDFENQFIRGFSKVISYSIFMKSVG